MNKMCISFLSKIENESFVRCCAASFIMPLNPNTNEILEIKTIISEAVSNAIIHAYDNNPNNYIKLEMGYDENRLITIIVSDKGIGIEDIPLAMQPLYTTKSESERCGMGMSIINAFSDSFNCFSKVNHGTKLVIQKQLQ